MGQVTTHVVQVESSSVTVNLNVRDLQVYSHVQPDSGIVGNVLQSPVIPVQQRAVDDPR